MASICSTWLLLIVVLCSFKAGDDESSWLLLLFLTLSLVFAVLLSDDVSNERFIVDFVSSLWCDWSRRERGEKKKDPKRSSVWIVRSSVWIVLLNNDAASKQAGLRTTKELKGWILISQINYVYGLWTVVSKVSTPSQKTTTTIKQIDNQTISPHQQTTYKTPWIKKQNQLLLI